VQLRLKLISIFSLISLSRLAFVSQPSAFHVLIEMLTTCFHQLMFGLIASDIVAIVETKGEDSDGEEKLYQNHLEFHVASPSPSGS
jgi:hypothetical protein